MLRLETLDDDIFESWMQILDSRLPTLPTFWEGHPPQVLERRTFAVVSDMPVEPCHSGAEMSALGQ
jgi:hypothetical protein